MILFYGISAGFNGSFCKFIRGIDERSRNGEDAGEDRQLCAAKKKIIRAFFKETVQKSTPACLFGLDGF